MRKGPIIPPEGEAQRHGKKRSVPRSARATSEPPRRATPVNLSSDWYWEQDAELRFTQVDLREGVGKDERELAKRIIGKLRWDTGIEIEGGWDAHRGLLEARKPFRDVLMWRDLEDGSRRWVSTSGEPVFDARGRFKGYRGIGRNVSEQKRAEARLRASEAGCARSSTTSPSASSCSTRAATCST